MIEVILFILAIATFLVGIYNSDRMHAAAAEQPDSWLSYILNTIDAIVKTKRKDSDNRKADKMKTTPDFDHPEQSRVGELELSKAEVLHLDLKKYNRPDVAKRLFAARFIYMILYAAFVAFGLAAIISKIISADYIQAIFITIIGCAFAIWMFIKVDALYITGIYVVRESWNSDIVVVICPEKMIITKGGVTIINTGNGMFSVIDNVDIYELSFTNKDGKYPLLQYHMAYLKLLGVRPDLEAFSDTLNAMLKRVKSD